MKAKPLNPEDIEAIILHASLSSNFPPFQGASVSEIHRWHLKNGWDGNGYHWVIEATGKVEAGRPEYWEGSHCLSRGMNKKSIGICIVKKADQKLNANQRKALKNLLYILILKYPKAEVKGHSDYVPRACPGFDAGALWKELKQEIIDKLWESCNAEVLD